MRATFRLFGSGLPVTILVLLLSMSGPALGAESARDHVEPVMSRADFAAWCSVVSLTREQQMIADFVFSDYAEAIAGLIRRTDEQAEEAGRERVERALAGRLRLPPDDLRDLRVAVLQAYAGAVPVAAELLDGALADLRELLLDEQRGAAIAAERDLRRRLLLQPRRENRLDQSYAGDGVDLIELVAEARRRGGELESLRSRELDDLLRDYELMLDAVLIESATDWLEGRLLRRIARVSRDVDATQREERRHLERWSRHDELNRAVAARIGRIIETELDPAAAQRWSERFDRACYPWLLERSTVDRQLDWIRRNEDDPALRGRAEKIVAEYAALRAGLAREAIGIMRRARVELRTVLYPMMDPVSPADSRRRDLYEQLLKNSGEQTTLESATAGRLEALLESGDRQRMRRETGAGGRRG